MNPVVIALVVFFTPTTCEAERDDLKDCSYYVCQLTDEELVEYMKHYEYISMIDDMEEDYHSFDKVLIENSSTVEVLD